MFTTVHNNDTSEEKMKAIYRHLYECNIRQLIKEQKVITDVWKVICSETAQADIRDLILNNNLEGYYRRLKEGKV